MNSAKIIVAIVLMATTQHTYAINISWFAPVEWFKAAKRAYYSTMHPIHMGLAKEKLQQLQRARTETENISKIYQSLKKDLSPREYNDTQLVNAIYNDISGLEKSFRISQNQIISCEHSYDISSISHFTNDILEPNLKDIQSTINNYEKDTDYDSDNTRKSWYERLKEKVQADQKNTPIDNAIRASDFSAWKYDTGRTNLPLSPESMELQEKLRRKQKNKIYFKHIPSRIFS